MSKIYKSNYIFSPSPNQKKQLKNFLDKLIEMYSSTDIDFDFLFKFVSFQFNYWLSLDYKKREYIEVNWIFGKKSIERWQEKKTSYFFFVERDFIKKYNIDKKILEMPFKKVTKKNFSDVKEWEEKIKEKHFNTEFTMMNCLDNTTLFNSKSSLCSVCSFRNDCIVLLRSLYPVLYKLRIQ